MTVGSVLIGLQASGRERGVSASEFLEPLSIQPGEVEAAEVDGDAWASGMVYVAVVRYADFAHVHTSADAGAQSIAFEEGVAEAFQTTARFLDRRPPAVTTAMREAGLELRLFVEVRMDQDQMELDIPPELLTASGRHALGVFVISNDISAAEVLAARQTGPGAAPDPAGT